MIKLIDSISYNNKLRSVSPLWKCGFAAALFVVAYVSHPAVQLLIMGWMFIWTVLTARVPILFYIRLLGTSYMFYAVSLPAIVIEIVPSHTWSELHTGTVIFSIFQWVAYISPSGVHTAAGLFLRIAACLSCLLFLMLTTPVAELLQVMKKLRMPSIVLEIMQIMYRFLFLLEDTAHDMYTAQKSRGGQTGFKSRLTDTAILIVRLFGKTMLRYKCLVNGLAARGFTDEITMAPLPAFTVPPGYTRMSISSIIVLILLELWLQWRELG